MLKQYKTSLSDKECVNWDMERKKKNIEEAVLAELRIVNEKRNQKILMFDKL